MVSPSKYSSHLLRILILAFLFYGTLAPQVFGEDIQVVATVDKNQITLEDTVHLSITIQGTQNTPPPELPSLPDFRIISTGNSTSTQIVNSTRSISVTYNYRLTPMRTGNFMIDPARVRANGKTFTTQPITLIVKKPSSQDASSNKTAFVETSVSREEAYIGEQLVYSFKLFHRVEAKNLNLSMPFGESYFQKEELGKAKSFLSVINGIQYQVQEISVALFPIKPGKAEIPAATLDLDLIHRTQNRSRGGGAFSQFFNDPFFDRASRAEHKVLRSNPLAVKILPLPEKGRPEGFKNIIGQFNIEASLGKKDLEVGDTTTLTITVSGKGNLRGLLFAEPDLKNLFKVYPDKPEFNQTVTGNQVSGQKIFKFALVPLKAGPVTVPGFSLPYFDTTAKSYKEINTRPIPIIIRPSSAQETLNLVQSNTQNGTAIKPEIEILGEDILPIHTQLNGFQDVTNRSWSSAAVGFVSPFILFFISAFFIRQTNRMKTDVAFFRSQKAYKTASQKLKNLAHSKNYDSKDFVRELSEILREYIGNKLNMEGKALTAAEIEQKFKTSNYQPSQIDTTRKLLERCETLQYAPASAGNIRELLNESKNLIKVLEQKS